MPDCQRFEPLGQPSTVVIERAMTSRDLAINLIFALVYALTALAMLGLGLRPLLTAEALIGTLFVLPYFLYIVVLFGMFLFSARSMRTPQHIEAPLGVKVAFVTPFVPSREPLSVLAETLRAIVAVRYPHDTYVLDEENDPDVRRLCAELGVIHFSRHGRPEYNQDSGPFRAKMKAGNLNAWLDAYGHGKYDVVTFIDCDHIPVPEYLDRVLGYFRDPTVGFVQGPQIYHNQREGFIARGAAEQTYGYYGHRLKSLYGAGVRIIDGCHTTFRLETFKRIGGYYPVHVGEDLLLGYVLMKQQIGGIYCPEVLARGLAPVSWQAYLSQQGRWAHSGVNIKWRHFIESQAGMSPMRKLMFLQHGLIYFNEALTPIGIAMLCFFLLRGGAPPIPPNFFVAYFVAMVCAILWDVWLQKFNIMPEKERGLFLRPFVLDYGRWPTLLGSFVNGMRGGAARFIATRKDGGDQFTLALFRPQIFIGIVLVTCVVTSLYREIPNQGLVYFFSGWKIAEIVILILVALVTSGRRARSA